MQREAGWGGRRLSLRSAPALGLSTVKDYEGGKRTPIPNNLEAMQRALEQAGIGVHRNGITGPIKAAK